jgi:hypothetical protein
MKIVQINNHKTLGLVSVKFKFEHGTAIVDTWSPLQSTSVGNYTIELKDVKTTEIELQSSHDGETEWQDGLAKSLEKGHFLILFDSKTNKIRKLPLDEILHIYHPATNDGTYEYVISGIISSNIGTIGTKDFIII